MKEMRRVLALILCFVMLVGYVPANAFAAEAETTAPSETVAEAQTTEAVQTEAAAVAEEEVVTFELGTVSAKAMGVDTDLDDINTAMDRAKAYIDALTINNSSNDPETVVKTFKTHFTWDNEKRENSKSYLFDWSYYNGVVFEGLKYLYEATGDEAYKDYVMEYMSSLIASDGTWAKCTNDTSKVCAGYDSTHGADCYKTASLLLDAYEMSGDKRYLTMAATLYADLDTAAGSYSLKNAGNNYRHTWATDPTPDLWLDGLYMILPFRAEYAKYIGDTEELNLIVSRMQWVSDNMYNSSKGLFYHAADSASSNSGTFWLRSIGWYAAAIVDIMDSMEGDNLEAMKAQLVKLADGMIACQNDYGMWLNNMAAKESSTNPYETSGTALVCYAIMKAVNKGWLDETYADSALLALQGITTKKLDSTNTNLTDICFKGAPGSSNSTFYDNEGKGAGPFIMLYAEVVKHFAEEDGGDSTPDVTVNTVEYECQYNGSFNGDVIIASGKGLTAVSAVVDESVDYSTIFDTNLGYSAYAVNLEGYIEGETVELTLSACNVQEENLAVYEIVNGVPVEITDYVVSAGDGFLNVAFDITAASGIYAIGTRAVTIPENAVLTKVEITKVPSHVYYFVEDISALKDLPLDITDMEVKATYANDTESVTKTIYWNGYDETKDGYALTFDMTVLGEQDVVVSYTYDGVTLTDTFGIEIVEKVIHVVDIPEIKFELTIPGPITVKVVENTEDEDIKAALETIFTTYISYDFTLEGYTQGDKIKVTLPLPENVEHPAVYHIPSDGAAPERIFGTEVNEDNTITFTATHFSTYAVGETLPASESVSGSDEGEIEGETSTKYVLVDTLTSGKEYLIVNTNATGTGRALRTTTSNASVTITVDGSDVVITNPGNAAVWTATASGSGWSFHNGSGYLGYTSESSSSGSGNSRYTQYSYTLAPSSSTSRTWTVENNRMYINLVYRDYSSSNRTDTYNNYYIRSGNSNWSMSTSSSSVYFYEKVEVNREDETVELSVTYATDSLKPGDTSIPTVAVKVGDNTTTNYTIEWESSNTSVATVDEDGVVTAKGDGEVTITAKLTYANGLEVTTVPSVSLDMEVKTKKVTGIEFKDNNKIGYVYVDSGSTTSTGATLTVFYDDNSSETVNITVGMLSTASGAEVSTAETGTFGNLKVTYSNDPTADFILDGFTLVVEPKPDLNYPEYPDPGSVDVNKYAADTSQFQDIGVAQIELTTSGIPMKRGVDVVLTVDISNSMAWEVGTNTDDFTTNKLTEVMSAINSFADTFLAPYDDGTPTDNTITIVTFAGFDNDHTPTANKGAYIDSVRTLISKTSSVEDIRSITSQTKFTQHPEGDDYYIQLAYENANGEIDTDTGKNRGDTNYDYAFWQTEQAIINNGLGTNEREVYVLFMTDGCASNFNNIYYRTNNVGYYYQPGTDDTAYTANGTYTNGANWTSYIRDTLIPANNGNIYARRIYDATDYNMTGIYAVGFDMAHGSFSGIGTWNANTDWESIFNEIVSECVVDDDGNGLIPVTNATDTDKLKAFYETLASELRYAATEAYYMDQLGDSFNIQTSAYKEKFNEEGENYHVAINPAPAITISTYKVYTAKDVGETINDVTVTQQMVGERYGEPTVLETVVFNMDGTAAYELADATKVTETRNDMPDADDNPIEITYYTGSADKNILAADGVIYAQNFWYNTSAVDVRIDTNGNGELDDDDEFLEPETFRWNIGTINETEYVMNYFVVLEGAAEGEATAGTYATNNFATLYYKNWLGNDAEQSVTSPTTAWKAAQVSYGFYLVDKEGNPVTNRATGATGSFYDAVKVTQDVFYSSILLNAEKAVTLNINTVSVLPEGYIPYNSKVAYTVSVDSSNKASGWVIWEDTDGDGVRDWNDKNGDGIKDQDEEYTEGNPTDDTTYVRGYSGSYATNEKNVNEDSYDYTHTTVWFAVVWEPKTVPDAVVVDYGLPVDIDVLYNDMFGANGTLMGVGDPGKKPDTITEPNQYVTSPDSDFTASYTATYGKAALNNGKVRYTPQTMAWNGEDQDSFDTFSYEARYKHDYTLSNGTVSTVYEYYYGDVTVIPATIIYYEDTFQENTSGGITYTGDWYDVGTAMEDPTQAEDRPGQYNLPAIDANNVYGYDAAYAATAQYSLGTAKKITVSGSSYGTAEFEFYGTGFDVISLTSSDTGYITVEVLDAEMLAEIEQTLEENPDADVSRTDARVASRMVDTYYGYDYGMYQVTYKYEDGKWVMGAIGDKVTAADAVEEDIPTEAPAEGEETVTLNRMVWKKTTSSMALYQVPVIKVTDLEYGKYKVLITVAYNKWLDNVSGSSSYDFYLDAIRIYDPAGTEYGTGDGDEVIDQTIQDAYVADKEAWPELHELRNLILTAEDFNAMSSESAEGMIFIDQNKEYTTDANGNRIYKNIYSIADYSNYGPNNELYLAQGQSVAFELNLGIYPKDAEGNSIVADVQIAAKSADGGTVYLEMTRWNPKETTKDDGTTETSYVKVNSSTGKIATATDRYYSISSYVNKSDTVVLSLKNVQPAGVAATDGIISITNVKLTFTQDPGNVHLEDNPPAVAALAMYAPAVNSEEVVLPAALFTISRASADAVLASLNADEDQDDPAPSVPEETEPAPTDPEETEPEETIPEETEPEEILDADLQVSIRSTSVKVGSTVVVMATTSSDVNALTVNGKEVTKYVESRLTGKRTWTTTVKATKAGDMDIEVTAFSADSEVLETAVETIKVQEKRAGIVQQIIGTIIGILFR